MTLRILAMYGAQNRKNQQLGDILTYNSANKSSLKKLMHTFFAQLSIDVKNAVTSLVALLIRSSYVLRQYLRSYWKTLLHISILMWSQLKHLNYVHLYHTDNRFTPPFRDKPLPSHLMGCTTTSKRDTTPLPSDPMGCTSPS